MSFADHLNNGVLTLGGLNVTSITVATPDNQPDIIINSDSMKQMILKIKALEEYVTLLQQTYEIKNINTGQVFTLQKIQHDLGL